MNLSLELAQAKDLADIVENSFEGVIVTEAGKEHRFLYVNRAWERLTGWRREEVIMKESPRILKSGKQDEAFYKRLWGTITAGQVFTSEIINKRKDGSLYNAEITILPIKDGAGTITSYAEVSRDVTGRKQIEARLNERMTELEQGTAMLEATKKAILNVLIDLDEEKKSVDRKIIERTRELEEERAKLASVTQNMQAGAILLDTKGQVLFVNNTMHAYLAAMGADNSADPLGALSKVLAAYHFRELIDGCTRGKPFKLPEVDVANRVFSVSSTCIYRSADNLKEFFGHLVWIQDITPEKMLERSKSEFLAIASHEMRTPLTIIQGNAELLQGFVGSKTTDENLKKMISSILNNSVRLMGIVNDFLDLTRLEEGKIEFKLEPVDIAALMQDIVADLAQTAGRKGITITFEPPIVPLPAVRVDRDRVRQLLVNLAANAVHYTEKGGVTLAAHGGPSSVRIDITDTGPGIDASHQAMLFQKFQTAGKAFLHSREYGSGMGLYISALLAKSMGGKVWLEKSEVGKGSTFSIELPLVSAPADN